MKKSSTGNSAETTPALRRRRLWLLLGVLLVAVILYDATKNWRARLRDESARSRQAVAALEQEASARQQRANRQRELESTLATAPDDVETRLELARLRWSDAGPRGAALVLEPIGSRTTDVRALRMLAGAQRLMGREDLAMATLKRAAAVAPQDGDIRAEQAMLLSLLGWFPQTRQALQEAEKRGADAGLVAIVRATMARQQGDLTTARSVLEAVRNRRPNDPEITRQLAAVAEADGRVMDALDLIVPIAESENDPDLWLKVGVLYRLLPGPTAQLHARDGAERALALRPQHGAARLLLGKAQRALGEKEAARTTLEGLYREQPNREGVAFELAQLYRDLDLKEQAAPLMERHQKLLRQREVMRRAAMAVMARPHSARDHVEMGMLCLERGMVGRGILYLERALELNPRQPEVREMLAQARNTPSAGDAGEE
jgi:tetratricopeptide (TPR) repeat protein